MNAIIKVSLTAIGAIGIVSSALAQSTSSTSTTSNTTASGVSMGHVSSRATDRASNPKSAIRAQKRAATQSNKVDRAATLTSQPASAGQGH